MICIAALALMTQFDEPVERTRAIYRCPAKEAVGRADRLESLINEEPFDSLCIDPQPGKATRELAKGKMKFVSPSTIDTAANRKWRDATIAFVNGKISPKTWLARVNGLGETIHFLSSPKTPELRESTPSNPLDGTYSARSVFAEMFLVSWRGVPCIHAGDSWATRELPDAGRHQSWVLAMNDNLGPMLALRHSDPFLLTGKPVIVRADSQPGMLIFRQSNGKHVMTFFFNNSDHSILLPPIQMDHSIFMRGVDLEGPKPMLMGAGSMIEDIGSPD